MVQGGWKGHSPGNRRLIGHRHSEEEAILTIGLLTPKNVLKNINQTRLYRFLNNFGPTLIMSTEFLIIILQLSGFSDDVVAALQLHCPNDE